ncbi:hypothetical protein IEQ34_017649 [Dendrobium chrysotoxum]|uniref:Uncharacterized protein n=1 Tax=Dendrobium chrysotoxum TaxID=161865 RepID=A0AAV7GAX5_DENCH|nr:hypothetical protein IEQ34_017649 [Dendrobium chrysotoxum]
MPKRPRYLTNKAAAGEPEDFEIGKIGERGRYAARGERDLGICLSQLNMTGTILVGLGCDMLDVSFGTTFLSFSKVNIQYKNF